MSGNHSLFCFVFIGSLVALCGRSSSNKCYFTWHKQSLLTCIELKRMLNNLKKVKGFFVGDRGAFLGNFNFIRVNARYFRSS